VSRGGVQWAQNSPIRRQSLSVLACKLRKSGNGDVYGCIRISSTAAVSSLEGSTVESGLSQ
jgi:hypothetical protein